MLVGRIEPRTADVTRRSILSALFATWFLYLSGCETERPTTVRVLAGPSFELSGGGRLASLTISAPLNGQRIAFPCGKVLFPCPGLATTIWQITLSDGGSEAANVDGLRIIMDKLPEGYTQSIPSRTSEIVTFRSGIIYAYSIETLNAAGQSGYFYVETSGTVVPVDVPDLCASLIDGREVRVNCTTKEPFQEPPNLEVYVSARRKN